MHSPCALHTGYFPDVDIYRIRNALQHCIGACLVKASLGDRADKILECHEPNIPKKDRRGDDLADLNNNNKGMELGEERPNDCGKACLESLLAEELDFTAGPTHGPGPS